MYGSYSMGDIVYETKHVHQFLMGEMSYAYIAELNETVTGKLYDGTDEKEPLIEEKL